jgi:hypothetical protein
VAKHDCVLPAGLPPQTWRCPTCGRKWYWHPNAGKGMDLWLGNDNVRRVDGRKPSTTFWEWLCS